MLLVCSIPCAVHEGERCRKPVGGVPDASWDPMPGAETRRSARRSLPRRRSYTCECRVHQIFANLYHDFANDSRRTPFAGAGDQAPCQPAVQPSLGAQDARPGVPGRGATDPNPENWSSWRLTGSEYRGPRTGRTDEEEEVHLGQEGVRLHWIHGVSRLGSSEALGATSLPVAPLLLPQCYLASHPASEQTDRGFGSVRRIPCHINSLREVPKEGLEPPRACTH